MITLTDANRSSLERALERAQKEQLTIREGEVNPDGGSYYVTSKNGTYFVTIVPRGDGTYDSDCNCEAGQPTKSDRVPLICKHCSFALSFFRAFELRARSAGIITLCTCGNRIEADQQECDECIEARHEWQLEIEQEHSERPQAYGPFSAKNPPLCKYCGLPAQEEGEGKTCTARYEGYYAHPACEVKARKQVA